jgi:DNA gyrase subunit B
MNNNYDGNSVEHAEGIEGIRKNPGMYIGSTSEKGVEHLVVEILANSVDEAYNGHGDTINVSINEDGSISVEDFGRGMPVEKNEKTGMMALEMLVTKIHSSGKFNNDNYKTSRGLHGVGATATNALSEFFNVDVYRNGYHWRQTFAKGVKTSELQKLEEMKPGQSTGTVVTFKPDPEIFKEGASFNYNGIRNLCKDFCYLTSTLTITLKQADKHESFNYPNGIVDLVNDKSGNIDRIFPDVVTVRGEVDGVSMDIGFIYTLEFGESLYSYVNCGTTPDGGTHLQGFRQGFLRALNEAAKQLNLVTEKQGLFKANEVFPGMIGVIAVKIPDPEFEGQTKNKLNNKYVTPVVAQKTYDILKFYFIDNPKITRSLTDKFLSMRKYYEAQKKTKESFLSVKTGKEAMLATTGKLANCSGKDYKKNELFICEGDSAAGGLKSTRNATFQAVFPIRGKILNVETAEDAKIFANAEIADLITIIGVGFRDEVNMSKLKYDKIIISTDADTDGFHIACLLLTFFYKFIPQLIEDGHVYLSTPPLFAIKTGKNYKNIQYFYTEEEAQKAQEKLKGHMQRYKGLGEMSNEQTEELLINPETRVLRKITMEDFMKTGIYINRIMGDNSQYKRELLSSTDKRITI